MRQFSQTSPNQFFKNNALKPIPRATSYSSINKGNINTNFQQAKFDQPRRINPKNFVHREVFNSKLYQTASISLAQTQRKTKKGSEPNMKKFFQISLSNKQRVQGKFGDQQGIYIKQSQQLIKKHQYFNNISIQKTWKSLYHYFRMLQKTLRVMDGKDPLKITMKNINEQLQSLFETIFIQYSKSINKIKQFNLNITGRNRLTEDIKISSQQTIQSINNNQQQQSLNKNSSHIRHASQHQPSRQLQPLPSSQQQRKVNPQQNSLILNTLEFQNKKLLLLCQRLEQDLKQKDKQLHAKQQQCCNLIQKSKQVDKQRQGYQFKIKKLKEELEIAHIVKQQNLADKVNYILGWKL